MPKSCELTTHCDTTSIRKAVNNLDRSDEPLVVTHTQTVDQYVDTVFGDLDHRSIFIKDVARPANGVGPHFDIYNEVVSRDFPFVGTYNKCGFATLRATLLDEDLQHYYENHFGQSTELAKAARRPIGALALLKPDADVYITRIEAGTGLVIPQPSPSALGVHVVHDITPDESMRRPILPRRASLNDILNPRGAGGDFSKFIAPKQTKTAKQTLRDEGYKRYDEYLEQQAARRESAKKEHERKKRAQAFRKEAYFDADLPHGGGLLD